MGCPLKKSRMIMRELMNAKGEEDQQKAMDTVEEVLEEMPVEEVDGISICEMAKAEFGSAQVSEWESSETMESAAPVLRSSQLSKFFQKLVSIQSMRECPKEDFHLQQLIRTVNVPNCGSGDRRIQLYDDFKAKDLCEGEKYPWVGVTSDYMDMPEASKGGFRFGMTREVLCRHSGTINLFNLLGRMRSALNEYKEDKLYDIILGITPLYDRSGTLWETYYEANGNNDTPFSDAGPWINAQCNPFCRFEDLDESDQLFDEMCDLKTGEPCPCEPTHVFTSRYTAQKMVKRLLATSVECPDECDSDCRITGSPTSMLTGGIPTIVSSRKRLVRKIMEAFGVSKEQAELWWIHFRPDAMQWWSHWDEVTECTNPEGVCARDYAISYKASMRGTGVLDDPQCMAINTHCP